MVALRYADYGYILENGRVVMDGVATDLAQQRGREGVLPRAVDGRAQELPRRQALPAPQALAGLTRRAPRDSMLASCATLPGARWTSSGARRVLRRQDVRGVPLDGKADVLQVRPERFLELTDAGIVPRLPRARTGCSRDRACDAARELSRARARRQAAAQDPRGPLAGSSSTFDTLETRDPSCAARCSLRGSPRQATRRLRAALAVDPASRARRSRAAGDAQVRAAELQKARGRSAASRPRGWGEARRVFASPGPIYEPEGARGRLLAARARAVRRGLSRRRPRAQLLLLPLHAGGLDARDRRARAGLHGVPRRHRADRAAGAGDRRPRSRDGYVGTPSFLRIILEKADELRRRAADRSRKALVSGEAFPPTAARRVARARHRRLPGLRDGGPRQHRLRDAGARGARRRRGRAGRDRAARHRRPGARGRGRRGRRHDARQRRLPADPLRHRRPVGGAAGRCALRAHQPAHQGLDGPRRPDHQGQGHVRAPVAGRRDRRAGIPEIAQGAARRRQPGRQRPDDAARRGPAAGAIVRRRGDRRDRSATSPSCAARSRSARRRAAQRRQGDRRRRASTTDRVARAAAEQLGAPPRPVRCRNRRSCPKRHPPRRRPAGPAGRGDAARDRGRRRRARAIRGTPC